jgi:hypothetical protein
LHGGAVRRAEHHRRIGGRRILIHDPGRHGFGIDVVDLGQRHGFLDRPRREGPAADLHGQLAVPAKDGNPVQEL